MRNIRWINAYKFQIGQPINKNNIVNIFDYSGEIDKIATIEEQRANFEKFMKQGY